MRRSLPPLSLFLLLAACGSVTPPGEPEVVSPRGAPVHLTVPTPDHLRTGAVRGQYLSAKTTTLEVRVDGGAARSFVLGGAEAPCGAETCAVSLGALPPGVHTFEVGAYGVRPATGQTVLISRGRVTQTLSAGQVGNVTVTLAPANTAVTLRSAVQQYDVAARGFGNYARFATLNGRSLPAYYDLTPADAVGDALPGSEPLVLCGSDPAVAITNISDAAFPRRFRVEVRAPGPYTLSVQPGDTCTAGGTVLVTQAVSGVRPGGAPALEGSTHSLVLRTDGTVRAWGYNGSGQLGDGSVTSSSVPVPVRGLGGAVSVGAGYMHSLAALADGTVRTWGDNSLGQLGDGSSTSSPVPVTVAGLGGVVGLAAGDYHSLALLSDGTVRAWGDNGRGQLGDGSTTSSPVPVTVAGLGEVVSVAAGFYHSLALRADGTVRTWGYNGYGQLGDGSVTNSPVPVEVADLGGVAGVAAGFYHSLAVLSDGTVRTWGDNSSGQLGHGLTTNSSVPVPVGGLGRAVGVAAGFYHSLAVLSDGTVRAWGDNSSGQLGDGSTASSAVPVAVGGLGGVVGVAAGDSHNLALLPDGTVSTWGSNRSGQLGGGSVSPYSPSPAVVPGLTSVAVPTP